MPDLGEGLPDAAIVAWHVKVGDSVKIDQLLVAVETAKAIIDIPSPLNGTIEKLCAQVEDIVAVGQDLVIFDCNNNIVNDCKEIEQQDLSTLIGSLKTSDLVIKEKMQNNLDNQYGKHDTRDKHNDYNYHNHGKQIKASPAVRVLAKKMQLDLNNIAPTGPDNTINVDDLYNAHNSKEKHSAVMDLDLDEGWVHLNPTARRMALAMEQSHKDIVPATIFEDFVLYKYSDNQKEKLDLTINVILAIVFACSKEPIINSWFMKTGDNFKQKRFTDIHLGIAVDSEDGLFVPVIKQVQEKSAIELREELNLLLHQVKERTITPNQLQGATFVLSNFGKFAGRYALPIIVSPTVATLAIGSLRQDMVVINSKPTVKFILPGSLTFDHRAITGGQAARFLQAMLEFFCNYT